MKRIALIIAAFIAVLSTYGQEVDLAVSNIPEELLKDAVAVVRYDNTSVVLSDKGKAKVDVEHAITILNENGKRLGYVQLAYNKYIKYSKLNIELLDSEGHRIRKIKNEEIRDVSSISSASLYEDQRVIISYPEHNKYPYTVKVSYVQNLTGIMSLPPWYMISSGNMASQSSTYRLLAPKGTEIRYRAKNFDLEPDRSRDKEYPSYDSYYWESSNLSVIKYEDYSKNYSEIIPMIRLSPVEFEYGGVEGSYESWQTLGDWIWKLMDGKDQFTEEAAAEITGLVSNCTTDREKIETLYKYMQDKVRYVNISIGIGGFEPIPAQRVHEVSYGDCKALTNYMRSMLKLVDIESLYSIVLAGSSARSIDVEYPSQQFNHVILAVPVDNDTIWLECTSQRLPAGFLGDFTDDRVVLQINEDGGVLGRTPDFSLKDNFVYAKTRIDLDANFDAVIDRDKKYGGVYFDNVYTEYLHRDDEEKKKAIINSLSLSDFSLDSYSYNYELDGKPYICQNIKVTDDRVVTKNGEYYTMPFNLVNYRPEVPTRVRNRQQEVYLKRPKYFSDTISISIPEGYVTFELPEDKEIVSQFGKYTAKVEKTDDGVLYVREIEFYKGTFAAEEYRDFYQFYRNMSKAAGEMLVMVEGS